MLSEHIPITETMTAGDLHDDMMIRGADLLGRALDALQRGSLVPTPQPEEGVTYAKKIEKAESKINWSKSAKDIHNHIRGLSPFPGAWFEIVKSNEKKERIKIIRSALPINQETALKNKSEDELLIECGEGAIQLIEVQREGKKPMSAKDFLNGLQGELKIEK